MKHSLVTCSRLSLLTLVTMGLTIGPAAAPREAGVASAGSAAVNREPPSTNSTNPPVRRALPPLPPGVEEIKFHEFFDTPIGARGLTPTGKLRRLEGKRVRILGYMVRQERPSHGQLLLAPFPMQLHEHEYGLCDDLPPNTLFVIDPHRRETMVPYTPGLLLLTGELQLGNRAEPDGRISAVRLRLDPPTGEQRALLTAAAATNHLDSISPTDAHAGHGHSH